MSHQPSKSPLEAVRKDKTTDSHCAAAFCFSDCVSMQQKDFPENEVKSLTITLLTAENSSFGSARGHIRVQEQAWPFPTILIKALAAIEERIKYALMISSRCTSHTELISCLNKTTYCTVLNVFLLS